MVDRVDLSNLRGEEERKVTRRDTPPPWPDGEPKYFLLKALPYADYIRLQASDLIKSCDRDARNGNCRFWPPTKGVLTYLKENSPVEIWDDKGPVSSVANKRPAFKPQAPMDVSGGMEIADD